MNYEQVREHIMSKYDNGKDRATFLVEALKRDFLSYSTRQAIKEVLCMPICTGVVLGQLALKREKLEELVH